ncbi:MAG: hypothetical protein Greene041679_203 [Parcubacteria group bacterium Greene0416_79]|nr:MAG: hypothetical protein Greene041679_203 [Parcubacteria group bacterium Greene0416_79]
MTGERKVKTKEKVIPRVIRKKVRPEFFELIRSGRKRFELRLGDFAVSEGDTLLLQEWNPRTKRYTGRTIKKRVGSVLRLKIDELFWPKEEIERHGLQVIQLE